MTDVYTQSGTASGTATTYSLTAHYPFVAVTNAGTAALYCTTNGVAAQAAGAADYNYCVPTGATVVIPNDTYGYWTQAALNIPNGTNNPQGFQTLYGGTANPGTNVSVIGTGAFTIAGAG